MDILVFITSLSSGGAERQAVITAELLAKQGHNVTLATFSEARDHYTLDEKIVKRIRIGEGEPNRRRKLRLVFKYLKTNRFDWIITFGTRLSFIAISALYFRKSPKIIAGVRCIHTDHEPFYTRLLNAWMYNRAAYIVSNSYSEAEYLSKLKPKWKDKVKTITNYTDIDSLKFRTIPDSECLTIGILARYHPQKNIERFIHAIKIVKERTSRPFVFQWYGNCSNKDGNENPFYRQMAELAKELEVDDVIKLNDHVKDVKGVIDTFDAMCLPSSLEGFSNSLSEGICCGLPMLASDVADNSVMVKDGDNGILFNPLDVDEMAEKILAFIELPYIDRKAMGIRSREIAESLFDSNTYVKKYLDLIM